MKQEWETIAADGLLPPCVNLSVGSKLVHSRYTCPLHRVTILVRLRKLVGTFSGSPSLDTRLTTPTHVPDRL